MSIVLLVLAATIVEAASNAMEAGYKAVRAGVHGLMEAVWKHNHYKRTFIEGRWKL